jgi:hypothetical protein
MAGRLKSQTGSAYDLNSVSRDRAKSKNFPGVNPTTSAGARSLSPYTLRGESSLSLLRAKTEKNEPK